MVIIGVAMTEGKVVREKKRMVDFVRFSPELYRKQK